MLSWYSKRRYFQFIPIFNIFIFIFPTDRPIFHSLSARKPFNQIGIALGAIHTDT